MWVRLPPRAPFYRQCLCGFREGHFLLCPVRAHVFRIWLSPEAGKQLKDLKDHLVRNSIFFKDPNPSEKNSRNREFLERVEKHG